MRAGPWRITFVTNPDDCNLRCPMCAGHSDLARLRGDRRASPPRRMEIGLVRRVLDERRGTELREVIPSTMGEPLLWPELDALVDLCAARSLKLNLTTNGTFPGRGATAWAERLCPASSDVKISWNGAMAATAESIMPGLDFGAALADARAFLSARDRLARESRRCRVSFQVTAMEANVAELPAVVRLAASLGVDRVKVNHVQVHFSEMEAQSLRRDPEAVRRWNEAVRACRAAADEVRRPDGSPVELQNVVELSPRGDPAPRGPCPFTGREAWVAVDGRFAPCPAPGAALGQLGDFGSLLERTLGEIWEGGTFRDFVAGWQDHPVCRQCNLRRPGGA